MSTSWDAAEESRLETRLETRLKSDVDLAVMALLLSLEPAAGAYASVFEHPFQEGAVRKKLFYIHYRRR